MKLITGLITFLILLFASVGFAEANEGRISLKDGRRACEGISYWSKNSFQVAGRCGGLTYPYNGDLDRYVLWVKNSEGVITEIGEIENGIIEGSIKTNFDSVIITAEKRGYGENPTGPVVLSGNLERFNFAEPVSPQITEGEEKLTQTPLPQATPAAKRLGNIFSRNGVAILVGFAAVVAFVIFLTRGK